MDILRTIKHPAGPLIRGAGNDDVHNIGAFERYADGPAHFT